MTISISKKIAASVIAMTLASLISPADAKKKSAKTTAAKKKSAKTAAATTCTSTSPECCLVKRSWELMGKTTSVSSTNATACCYYLVSSTAPKTTQTSGIPGVRCTSDGIVTEIMWYGQSLRNSIPPELSNLVNLTRLRLGGNLLTGPIPSSLGNLVNLQSIRLAENQLSGPIPSSLGNLTNLQLIDLSVNQLNGTIPSSLGNLVNLQSIYLAENQLSGTIPSSLGNLTNLQELYLAYNPGLYGTFTPQCQTTSGSFPWVDISGTNVTICGCAAASNPPATFPPAGTPDACLATSGPALTLSKRILAFSQVIAVIGGYKYTCNTDANKNPYADCLNSMAKICNTADPTWDSTKKANCQTGVNTMFGMMNEHWQRVRKQCGQWSFTLNGITYPADPSDNCATANSNLIANAFYIHNGVQVRVDSGITNSTNERLWSQVKA